jgi:predicted DNA-binding transcriptional regulator AlpA
VSTINQNPIPCLPLPTIDPDALLDDRAVAALLACSPRHVRRLHDCGKFPRAIRFGKSVRWRRAVILKFILATEQAGHGLTREEFERMMSHDLIESAN